MPSLYIICVIGRSNFLGVLRAKDFLLTNMSLPRLISQVRARSDASILLVPCV